MKILFLIIPFVWFTITNTFSQISAINLHNNSNKTWIISELKIGNEVFADQNGTCVYSTEIEFFDNNNYKSTIPCSGVKEEGTYKLINNKLILSTDTLEIIELNSNTLKTNFITDIQIDNQIQKINVITIYKIK